MGHKRGTHLRRYPGEYSSENHLLIPNKLMDLTVEPIRWYAIAAVLQNKLLNRRLK